MFFFSTLFGYYTVNAETRVHIVFDRTVVTVVDNNDVTAPAGQRSVTHSLEVHDTRLNRYSLLLESRIA